MTKLEFAKIFIELVRTNKPLRAYQKILGLDKTAYELHLKKLDEYKKLVENSRKPKPVKTAPLSLINKLGKRRKKKKYEGEE